MERGKKYPKEIKDRAVRMVGEHQAEYSSQWACIVSISNKLGMMPQTLQRWIRKTESIGEPLKNGTTSYERIKELERENKELRRSNEILKSAAAFFGAELDRRHKK